MLIEMGDNLKQEQFEIIAEAIKNYHSKKEGIIKYLREHGQILDLKDEISIPNFNFSRELKDREIGIKSLPFFYEFINIRKIALIKMNLNIHRGLLDRWEKKGRQGLVLHDLGIHNDILRFLNQVEQFILRGIDTKMEFDLNDIQDKQGFNYFFQGDSSLIIDDFRVLHETVVDLTYKLSMNHYHPPFSLLTDSNTLGWANRNFFPNTEPIDSYKDRVIKLNDIDEWLDLKGNGDKHKKYEADLICMAKKRPYSDPIKVIEKEPLDIIQVYGGIVIYWIGGLEAEENAISRL